MKKAVILSTLDVARMAGVTTAAVLYWIREKKLPTVKPYRQSGHRIRKDLAQAWLRKHYQRGKRPTWDEA